MLEIIIISKVCITKKETIHHQESHCSVRFIRGKNKNDGAKRGDFEVCCREAQPLHFGRATLQTYTRGALPDFMEELSDALATIAVGDSSEVKKSKKWPLSTIASDRLASKVLASQY